MWDSSSLWTGYQGSGPHHLCNVEKLAPKSNVFPSTKLTAIAVFHFLIGSAATGEISTF